MPQRCSLPAVIGSGVTPENLGEILEVADGVIVASWPRHDGVLWSEVDTKRPATLTTATVLRLNLPQ